MPKAAAKSENIYGTGSPLDSPLYTLTDAAHHLRISPEQLGWFFGWVPFGPNSEAPVFSFRQLVDMHLRGASWVERPELFADEMFRAGYDKTGRVWGQTISMSPLRKADRRAPDAWAKDDKVVGKVRSAFSARVVFEGEDPTRFYPFTRARVDQPALLAVTIDPRVRFGRPSVKGVPTTLLNGFFKAGETAEAIAKAYRLTVEDVDEAVRFESGPLSLAWSFR